MRQPLNIWIPVGAVVAALALAVIIVLTVVPRRKLKLARRILIAYWARLKLASKGLIARCKDLKIASKLSIWGWLYK